MATTDPNSAVGQVQGINDALAKYFSDMTKYLSQGGTCPDIRDYLAGTDFSELHRLASQAQEGSSNYPNGTAIENIHHISAVTREFGLRTKSKSDYYGDGAVDATTESNYYATMKTVYASMIMGNVTPGGSL